MKQRGSKTASQETSSPTEPTERSSEAGLSNPSVRGPRSISLPAELRLMYGDPVSLRDQSELRVRAISVPARDVVYLRSLLEASEGLGFFVAKKGGDVLLVSPASQVEQLDAFVADLSQEIPIVTRAATAYHEVFDVLL